MYLGAVGHEGAGDLAPDPARAGGHENAKTLDSEVHHQLRFAFTRAHRWHRRRAARPYRPPPAAATRSQRRTGPKRVGQTVLALLLAPFLARGVRLYIAV